MCGGWDESEVDAAAVSRCPSFYLLFRLSPARDGCKGGKFAGLSFSDDCRYHFDSPLICCWLEKPEGIPAIADADF